MPDRAPSRITQILFWFDGTIAPTAQQPGTPVTPIHGVLPFIESDLANRYDLAVILTTPPPTFVSPADATVFARLFPASQIIRLQPGNSYPAQVEQLIHHPLIRHDECLLADANPRRVLDAIRAGLDATIYIDLWRFRRDLYLWRIVDNYE